MSCAFVEKLVIATHGETGCLCYRNVAIRSGRVNHYVTPIQNAAPRIASEDRIAWWTAKC